MPARRLSSVLAALALAAAAPARAEVTSAEARAIAKQAYVDAFPMLESDDTKVKQVFRSETELVLP